MGTTLSFQRNFGHFLLLKLIARGGMAEIFRAMSYGSQGFSKLVAVKRILPDFSSDPQYVDMFVHEAKLAAHLHHTNIVQIVDFGSIQNQLYQSMEYVHGKNLAEIVQAFQDRKLPPPVEPACRIVLEALYGLEHAHQLSNPGGAPMRLIHRDITPANLLVSYDGVVKIADFGIAKTSQTTLQTVGGVVKGKQKYMSPEQALGQPMDQRTDLFSLGLCFYELLTLHEAFSGVSELELLTRVADARFTPPRQRNPAVPPRLEEILMRVLAKDPADRYPDAAAWRGELESFLQQEDMAPGGSWMLRGFMQESFSQAMEKERAEIAREAAAAESLRGAIQPEAVATRPAAPGHLGTMLHPDLESVREKSKVTKAPPPPGDRSRLQDHPTPHVLPRFVQDQQRAEQEQPLEDKPTLRAMPSLDEEEQASGEKDLPLGERPTHREIPAFDAEPGDDPEEP